MRHQGLRLTQAKKVIMQDVKKLKFGIAAFIFSLSALASASASAQDVIAVADGVNMWDGQWHYDATVYGWVPWIYTTVDLPSIAGGGSQTITTEPHQYLKYVEGGVLVEGTVRKGDWSLWTDFVFLNLKATPPIRGRLACPAATPSYR